MRIACIGNMNGLLFPTCKYLIDLGHEVVLFLLDEYDHFKPPLDEIPSTLVVHDLGWNEASFSKLSEQEIRGCLTSFDFYIGTDYSAAFLAKIGLRIDIYFPAGTDLTDWPFKSMNGIPRKLWQINQAICARSLLLGIHHARFLSLNYSNEQFEIALEKIQPKGGRMLALPFAYIKDIEKKKNAANYPRLKVVSDNTFIVMQHSRQAWGLANNSIHNKGNDVLIRGFSKFIKSIEEPKNAKLILVEYGESILKSKILITDLSIDKDVIWIPKLNRNDAISLVSKAHISVGNLYFGGYYNGAVMEALLSGVVYMGYRKDSMFVEKYDKMYPMINVSNSDDIFEKLKFYYEHPNKLIDLGKRGKDWFLNVQLKESLNQLQASLTKNNNVQNKLPIDIKLVGLKGVLLLFKAFLKIKTLTTKLFK